MTINRLLVASSIIENAPYLFQNDVDSSGTLYGLRCASSQSKNCPNSPIDENLYGLRCASSQSKNCPNTSIDDKVA